MLRLSALLLFLAAPIYAQIPPDLANIESYSCTVVEHSVASVLNAKTGQYEDIYAYRAEPHATYKGGATWPTELEVMKNSKEKRTMALVDTEKAGDATDACLRWN